jgi:hypothetical protein
MSVVGDGISYDKYCEREIRVSTFLDFDRPEALVSGEVGFTSHKFRSRLKWRICTRRDTKNRDALLISQSVYKYPVHAGTTAARMKELGQAQSLEAEDRKPSGVGPGRSFPSPQATTRGSRFGSRGHLAISSLPESGTARQNVTGIDESLPNADMCR